MINIKYGDMWNGSSGEMNIDIAKWVFNHYVYEFNIMKKVIQKAVYPQETFDEIKEELNRVKRLNDVELAEAVTGCVSDDAEELKRIRAKYNKKLRRLIEILKTIKWID